jgi:hypothetical protein
LKLDAARCFSFVEEGRKAITLEQAEACTVTISLKIAFTRVSSVRPLVVCTLSTFKILITRT